MEEQIRKIILDLEADVCGIGGIERFEDAPEGFAPRDIYPKCLSVITFGVALPKGLYQVEPRLIYSHFNDLVTKVVDNIAFKASKIIEDAYDCHCVPIPCDAPNEYWESDTLTARGLISMKHAAVACGMGTLGKSTLFINKEYGNRLTIGAILTDLKLSSDPLCEALCLPNCRICIDNCPVQAIGEQHVAQKQCRQNTYGKTARGFDTVDCNNCRKLCPLALGKSKL